MSTQKQIVKCLSDMARDGYTINVGDGTFANPSDPNIVASIRVFTDGRIRWMESRKREVRTATLNHHESDNQ